MTDAPTIGDNSVAGAELVAFVERVEHVQSEIDDLNADKSEIFVEARSRGFNVKALKKIIARRRLDPAERAEQEALIDLYQRALDGLDCEARRG